MSCARYAARYDRDREGYGFLPGDTVRGFRFKVDDGRAIDSAFGDIKVPTRMGVTNYKLEVSYDGEYIVIGSIPSSDSEKFSPGSHPYRIRIKFSDGVVLTRLYGIYKFCEVGE